MPYAPRPTTVFPASTASTRQTSSNSASSQPSSALAARIAAKRSELENLKQLRDLSGALAGQMVMLEEKLATLRDGTEAVACVLGNWDNVLRAISMASSELSAMMLWAVSWVDRVWLTYACVIVRVPRPANVNGEEEQPQRQGQESGHEPQLPVTLVRIPAQSPDPRQRHVEADGAPS
jgi:DASH complex subunit DAD2